MLLNLAQGAPREEHLPHSPQSPLAPARPISAQQPKYHSSHAPNRLQTTIISPQTSSMTDDEFSDSNGALAYAPSEYPLFIHNYEESYYPSHHQEMFYAYSDPEISQHHLMGAAQQRPFSASSSSNSSTESEQVQLQNLNGNSPYNGEIHSFNAGCFNNNSNHGQPPNWQEFKPLQNHSAGYPGVIVDAQQYHEYVH